MATTSIWHVKGYLSKVLIYVQNPEKCEDPEFFSSPEMTHEEIQGLADLMEYATNPSKTEQRLFVSGVNCDPASAREDMMAVKRGFQKTDGIVAWHGYQSFKPGEVTPEIAHEIGVKLAQEMWGERFQVVVSTHLDQKHLHNHFVVNSVSWLDGKRWYRKAEQYRQLRSISDRLCREYKLSIVEKPKQGRSRQYGEWRAEREGKPTWRSLIKTDVDEAIAKATSTRQFFQNLKNLGYEIKLGKDISVRPPDKERFFRLERNFGEDYSEEAIKRRILSHMTPQLSIEKQTQRPYTQNRLPAIPKGTIVGLYRHYCYLFGAYKKNEGGYNRMPFELREELRHFDEITADEKLLIRTGIKTPADLEAFQSSVEAEISALVLERKSLQAGDRKANGGETPGIPNPRIEQINERLKPLRREVRQCKRITKRSIELAEKLGRIEKRENTETRKEVKGYGRNRTGNRPAIKGSAHGL